MIMALNQIFLLTYFTYLLNLTLGTRKNNVYSKRMRHQPKSSYTSVGFIFESHCKSKQLTFHDIYYILVTQNL